ncbi:MAG: hypothetical protein HY822_24625 [Acidobacteria bacterium]|nr:hypothetical protein [Acidobacteriota bacterium]
MRLVRAQLASKLARAKRQSALLCPPDSIVHSDPALIEEIESQLRKDWNGL